MPVFFNTATPTFPVDPLVLQRMAMDAIQGTRPEEIKSYIQGFPFSDYQMVGVSANFGVEYYCVDSLIDHIKNELRSGRPWEPHLAPYIFKYCRPGSMSIDVGAHIGTHTIQLSRAVGSQGRVLAIEPQPKIFRELVVNMALNQANNIDFFWGAAGSKHSSIELSPLVADNEGGTGLGQGGMGQFVNMTSLDSLHLENVSFIKIDVEGMEIDVLRGAQETILKNQPIILIEFIGGLRPSLATNEQKRELVSRIRFLEALGYEVIPFDDTSDYLAFPISSPELQEMQNTRFYRQNASRLKRWTSKLSND